MPKSSFKSYMVSPAARSRSWHIMIHFTHTFMIFVDSVSVSSKTFHSFVMVSMVMSRHIIHTLGKSNKTDFYVILKLI